MSLKKPQQDCSEDKHICIVCQEELVDDGELRKHLQSHDEEFTEEQFKLLANPLPNGRLECLVCGETLARKRNFQVHYKRKHTTKLRFECPLCQKGFKFSKDFIRHRETHDTNRTRHECEICGKIFTRRETFAAHIKSHSAQKERCEVCFRYFPGNLLCRHYYYHTTGFKVACGVCGKQVRERQVRRHVILCHGTKRHVCIVCGAKYKGHESLVAHMRRHTEEPVDVCIICSKPFYCKSGYVHHMERTHDCGTKKWKCLICTKAFYLRRQLEIHMPVHTKEKPFKCEVCGKGFSWKHKVKDHMRSHSEERPFQCTICNEAFKWKHNLANHHRAKHVSI